MLLHPMQEHVTRKGDMLIIVFVRSGQGMRLYRTYDIEHSSVRSAQRFVSENNIGPFEALGWAYLDEIYEALCMHPDNI